METSSEKGGRTLYWNGYKYGFNQELLTGEVCWVCTYALCSSYVKTVSLENRTVLFDSHNHIHPMMKVEVLRLYDSVKRKAVEYPDERPSRIIYKVLEEARVDRVSPQDLTALRKVVYRARKKLSNFKTTPIPEIIQTCEERHKTSRDSSKCIMDDMDLDTKENEMPDGCDKECLLPVTVAEIMESWPLRSNLPNLRSNLPNLEIFNKQPAFESSNYITNRNCHQQLNPSSSTTHHDDSDFKFFMNLLPLFKRLNHSDKAMIKAQIQQLIFWKLPKTS